jgi:hypothetical protein
MATTYPFEGKPETLEETVFLQGLSGIMRTSGSKTAFGAQPWRNDPLVEFDQYQEGDTQYTAQYLYQFFSH